MAIIDVVGKVVGEEGKIEELPMRQRVETEAEQKAFKKLAAAGQAYADALREPDDELEYIRLQVHEGEVVAVGYEYASGVNLTSSV
jgi:hypothetical protein